MKNVEIVYENEEILLINKEAGISVQGGAGIAHPLDEELSKQLGYKIFLVHRLDKETSGLMIVAKSPQAANKWISLIAGKQVKKEYTAVCFGLPQVNGKTVMSGTLRDSVTKAGREMSAVTNFNVLAFKEISLPKPAETLENDLPDEKIVLSLVHLTLGTGRMHQIRIHLAKALAPIVQDDKHGNFKLNKKVRRLGFKKLCLASTRITIPLNGKPAVFTIEEPEHIQNAMRFIDTIQKKI